jgi:alpha-L-fucosidase 2
MWVRLQDGQLAYDNIVALLGHSTLPNLFCDHPPFQIDGNLGGTAAITEMLMQSHEGEIHLLPAIPSHWTEGIVSGLRARGGVELSFSWKNSKIEQVSIKASKTSTIWIRCGQDAAQLQVVSGKTYELNHYLELVN